LRTSCRWKALAVVEEVEMPTAKASDVVRKLYSAYEKNDRDLAEAVVAEDFTFSSPPDPYLDRGGYFERCWPNGEQVKSFRFQKIIEDDGEVFVTYELEKTDGSRGRNTEFFVVDRDRVKRCEVYFGPSL
jgi:ketosteroid isomerase-like protein